MLCCFVSSHTELLGVSSKAIFQVSWGDDNTPVVETFGAAHFRVHFGMMLFHLLNGVGL